MNYFTAWWRSHTSRSQVYDVLLEEKIENDTTAFEHFDDEVRQQQYDRVMIHPARSWDKWSYAFNIILLALLGLVTTRYIFSRRLTDRECGSQVEVWSPAHAIIEYEQADFDNIFGHESIYSGPPTPELEAAWFQLWSYGLVRIPQNKLSLLNRTADLGQGGRLIEVDDGKGGYEGMLEVFHQLHCLNIIRQYTWRDWYFEQEDIAKTPIEFLESDVDPRVHVDHCMEKLRVTLMCHADVTPLLRYTDATAPGGHGSDFNTHHKCRKFDKLQQRMEKNQVPIPTSIGRHGLMDELSPRAH